MMGLVHAGVLSGILTIFARLLAEPSVPQWLTGVVYDPHVRYPMGRLLREIGPHLPVLQYLLREIGPHLPVLQYPACRCYSTPTRALQ
eukprot:SAG11_NODE_2191_length_3706_cov_2.096756_4_plen_88_part_00